MSKRIKSVYRNFAELTHEWVLDPQRPIRCGNGFGEYGVIYSYGRHFPIARIVEDKKKGKVMYFTLATYSSTTGKHVSDVERGTRHIEKLYMIDVPTSGEVPYHNTNIKYWENKIKNALGKIPKARKGKEWALKEALHNVIQLEKYVAWFKVKLDKETKKLIVSAKSDVWTEQIAEWKEKKAAKDAYNEEHWDEVEAKREADKIKRKEAKIALGLKKHEESIAKWRAGETYRLPRVYGMKDMLRYNDREGRIETSQSVQIPVEIAKRFYERVQKVIKKGGCVDNCNDKLMDYEVKEIKVDELIIGCHRISMIECDNIAKQLNWI